MSKKIIFLCGSPRANGNTNTLVNWVAQAAQEAGAITDIVSVVGIESRSIGCRCCLGCQNSDKYECVISDDVSDLMKRILQYDIIVFATPVYFFGPSAQLKNVMDRMFCHIKMNPQDGSYTMARNDLSYGLIASAGGDLDGGLNLTRDTFQMLADFTGRPFKPLFLPLAPMDPAELQNNIEIRNRARIYGRDLVS